MTSDKLGMICMTERDIGDPIEERESGAQS